MMLSSMGLHQCWGPACQVKVEHGSSSIQHGHDTGLERKHVNVCRCNKGDTLHLCMQYLQQQHSLCPAWLLRI